MWSPVLLCFIVGFAYAAQTAWKDQTEYIYEVRGRTLTSLDQISNDYSGIYLKAKLRIKPRAEDGNLDAQIFESKYAQIHREWEKGWDTTIPDSELSYNELPLSPQPFQIVMNNGVIRDLIVSQDLSNWEANVIKSIVSQFQLDTEAENLMNSHMNMLTQEGSNTAMYKTMEETVTGISETLYEVHPLPEYILQTTPWLAPFRQLKEDGEVSEIVKSKNFTRSERRPCYHFGFDGVKNLDLNNKIGEFFTRSSVSRAVITGSMKDYTVQSSVTVDQITVNPTLNDKQRGSVNTMINVTLLSVEQQSYQNDEISNPVHVGLVYRYNKPYSNSNEVRSDREYEHEADLASYEAGEVSTDYKSRESSSSSSSSSSEDNWEQDQPKLSEAPESPLLPFTVGYDGQSIKKKQNVVENVKRLSQKIGEEFQRPVDMPKQNTIGKFVILTSLVRVMDKNEVQQVADQLYSEEKSGPQAATWKTYRDAVAQAGTGPCFIVIKDWIKTDKIRGEEAAEIVAVAANAARQPTAEYMNAFYKMILDTEVMSQSPLNESVLLSYTKLVHQVYLHSEDSHNKYPVHSFGSFYSNKGREFAKGRVIPELAQKLHEAVAKADTQNIHLYIRALGNIGHRKILEAFEPYLEGKKQTSQFQRLLMVLALNKLAISNPKVARSVLYKIYQNSHEDEQVRVAAVYQLMATNPPADMLQRMAFYTNQDQNNHVNSAVKSAIESACQLKAPEYTKLRSAAQSAKPLLTTEQYGAQYSHKQFRDFVVDQMKLTYKQSLQVFGGADYNMPKGFKYYLQGYFGGIQQDITSMQAIVSSADDLINVLQQQTEKYQQQMNKKHSYNSDQHKYSSEYIAKLLNMVNEQREQLEGNLYLEMGSLQKIWSFDNKTIEHISEVIRQLEEELKEGKSFNYHKMSIQNEAAVSFPTAMGLPFIYTFDRPIFVKLQGNVRASATPSVSSGKLLSKPESLNSQFEVEALISGRTQSQFGFFTPHDHQRYSSGYEKNFQVVVPLVGSVDVDLQNNQLQLEIENQIKQKEMNLLHYSTVPYTAKNDIYSPKPEKKVLSKKHPYLVNEVIGQKSTGIGFYVRMISDEQIDYATIWNKLSRHDLTSALLSPWLNENIQHMEINVGIHGSQSSTDKITVKAGCKHTYNSGTENMRRENQAHIRNFEQIPEDSIQRQKEFIKMSSSDVNSDSSNVYDASVEFSGSRQVKYTATIASSKSDVDSKGRLLLQLKKHGRDGKPMIFYLSAKGHFPNTNGLNLEYAMNMDSSSKVELEAAIGENYRESVKISANARLSKSEERKRYWQEQSEYKECQRQMQEGNYQLPLCAKMTERANLLDQFIIHFDYQNVNPLVVNQTYKFYSLLREQLYPRIEENVLTSASSSRNNGRLVIEGQFHPNLQAVNFSIDSQMGRVQAENVKVNEWARTLLVSHPVFHLKSRVWSQVYKYYTYRPVCVIDQNSACTFDNKTYPLQLQDDWTVLLQYVPRTPSSQNQLRQSVPSQLREQIESYVVLARKSPLKSSQKEVKMVIQAPSTQGKVVDITLKPSGQYDQLPKLFVDNQEINYNTPSGARAYEGYLKMYLLPNNDVKVEIYKSFYIIYDGTRVKLTAVDSKFNDASRGLCGTFTGEPETDFLSPENCIMEQPEEFVQSYILGDASRGRQEGKCHQKKVAYANVISSKDIGRSHNHEKSRRSCTMHQTQYVEQQDEICFTLRPLPVCKSGCQQRESINKNIPVHCAKSSDATNLWKAQIDKGANPNFSLKSMSRKINMELPLRCSA